ncbi:tRNA pseudouridine(38-40) synthase TruA [Clostridium cylindrosporum]|uniref:tRNA pseudouridine synthase A n=1 Tax=Clostridium cylindrosporum DSM 605 TaxID=1121307 RepID=A0A0J8D5S7_CLOCY|nr:tRNA pseudouridine(38-40) synthase TruA [Clostridium cylindrosporum]KMT21207.1 tRNA pseudouridine synthase A [Clostridium cylindrosporum DSM 605]
MRNIKLTLEYDGTNYCGWQRQINGISIEETLEKVIIDLFEEDIKILGSSRTDSGVHARGQVVCFKTKSTIPTHKIPGAINSRLPRDIVVVYAEEVDMDFHPIYSTKGKMYSYRIINRKMEPALMRNYYWHVGYNLNFEHMQKAATYFIGEHDFSSFKSQGGSTKDSIREIYSLNLTKDGDYITVTIEGNGFLYNMVRIIVGTLIDVGRGRIPYDSIGDIIKSKDRRRAGITAQAHGLYLEKVYY